MDISTPPHPGRMAQAMSTNLREGANSAILGRGPPTTYNITKVKITIFRREANFGGGKFAILGVNPENGLGS